MDRCRYLNTISGLGASEGGVDLSNQSISSSQVRGRGFGNQASIQSLGLSVQVLDVTLDQCSSEEDGIELRLLGNDGSQSRGNLRNKSSDGAENSISFLGGNGTRDCTAVGTGFLEASFKNLFLVVDGQSTRVTAGAGKGINLA